MENIEQRKNSKNGYNASRFREDNRGVELTEHRLIALQNSRRCEPLQSKKH